MTDKPIFGSDAHRPPTYTPADLTDTQAAADDSDRDHFEEGVRAKMRLINETGNFIIPTGQFAHTTSVLLVSRESGLDNGALDP